MDAIHCVPYRTYIFIRENIPGNIVSHWFFRRPQELLYLFDDIHTKNFAVYPVKAIQNSSEIGRRHNAEDWCHVRFKITYGYCIVVIDPAVSGEAILICCDQAGPR